MLKAWNLPTTRYKPFQTRKPLQVPSVISERFEKVHDTQFQKWYDEMLENTRPESRMKGTKEIELQDTPYLENIEGVLQNQNIYEDMDDQWDIPSPVQSPSEGGSLNGAQLDVQKLMSFLGMRVYHNANQAQRRS